MKVGKRILGLLDWAANHSPRSKELHRYIVDLHQAIATDVDRSKKLVEIAGQMQKDRNAMAGIAFKLAQTLSEEASVGPWRINMTSDEYRLYAAARINVLVMPYMGKPLDDETRAKVLGEGEVAFEEVKSLGCPEDLIADMRNNFHKSLQLQPPEDEALTEEQSVAIVSSGG